MQVTVNWQFIADDDDPQWRYNCGLYAYLDPADFEILYIGKVYGCTVRQRHSASDKGGLWDYLNSLGIENHHVLVGTVALRPGSSPSRLTGQMIADVESLLINQTQPRGNIQCRGSRIMRPGMRVTCAGAWPLEQRVFLD